MILDTKRYTLTCGSGKEQEVYKVSKSEMRLLLLLINNEIHSLEEIKDYLNLSQVNHVRVYINRVRRKMKKLDIISIREVGYILRSTVKVK